jgi:hypothetical protein
MHDQTQSTGADTIQTFKPRYADILDGTITVYAERGHYVVMGRFNGQIYKEISQTMEKATGYGRAWLELQRVGGLY